MKKLVIGASLAVAGLLFSCSGGAGPEESAKNYIEALNAEDFEKAKEFATKESAGMLDLMKMFSGGGMNENSAANGSIDGVYIGSKDLGGIKLSAELTINGSQWSAESKLGNDRPEYQNGVVKGKDLYDDSGMIKIGYVSGNSANINGYPRMSQTKTDTPKKENVDATPLAIKDLKCTIATGDTSAICTFVVDGKEEKLDMKKRDGKWLAHQPKEGPPGGLDPGMMDMDAPADSADAMPASEQTESK